MSSTRQTGFTFIEVTIVVVIIAVLAAIAVPSYQRYVVQSKRTDMMTELQNIGTQIQSRKLSQGTYGGVILTNLTGTYPKQGQAIYTVTVTPTPLTKEWVVTATPIANTQVANDGVLTFNYVGVKCRATTCGTNKEWND